MPKNFIRPYNHNFHQEGSNLYHPDNWEAISILINPLLTTPKSEALEVSIDLRLALFQKIKSSLSKVSADLCSIYCEETGLTELRFNREFERVLFQLDHFSAFIQSGGLSVSEECKVINGKAVTYKRSFCPIGNVFVIGASNFPLAYSTIGGDVVSALSAGCRVVYKAHLFHVGTSLFVANLIQKCLQELQLPKNLFVHFIDDKDHTISTSLIQSGWIHAVGFTGSQAVGRYLMDQCAALSCPIPVFAEMGSVNPVVLLPKQISENISEYASLLASSVATDAGQFCTKPGIIFYPKSSSGKSFKEALIASFCQQPHYHMLHPLIHERYQKSLTALSGIKDVEVILNIPGEKMIEGEKMLVEVSASTFMKMPELHEEVFGPFALLVSFENIKELVEALKMIEGQLTGTIIGDKSEDGFLEVLTEFKNSCGRIILNGVPTGVNVSSLMQHGGPYPSSSDSRFTAVGSNSIWRFIRPITFQNF